MKRRAFPVAMLLVLCLIAVGCASGAGRRHAVGPNAFVGPSPHPGPTPQRTGPEHQRLHHVFHAARRGEVGVNVPPRQQQRGQREQDGGGGSRQAQPHEPRPSSPSTTSSAPGGHASADTGATKAVGSAGASAGDEEARSYALDAMVGQVNGQPIYADTVLKPIEDQLAALGRQLPRQTFRSRARQLILSRMRQLVGDALIFGEARRDLSKNERRGLDLLVKRKREDLLRRYGRGAPSLAEHNLKQKTGTDLDQTLEDYRKKVVVQRYLRKKLLPKINVGRRDVERYYREHGEEFHQKPARVLRLIRVKSRKAAQRIRRQLESGRSFAKVASSQANLNRPDSGGLMPPITGARPFSSSKLNQAVARLAQGRWAGPVRVHDAWVFVYLKRLRKGQSTSLEKAQLAIERRLGEEKYRRLSAAYRRRLFKQGSYNSIQQMTDDLIQIAMNRYAA